MLSTCGLLTGYIGSHVLESYVEGIILLGALSNKGGRAAGQGVQQLAMALINLVETLCYV